ncbi:hypothetical protein OH492_06275 [Vibrio chagasii]|nr:hypothetical protein [Vibrio chagasii]
MLNGLAPQTRTQIDNVRLGAEFDIDLAVADAKYTFLHDLCKRVRRSEGKLSRNFIKRKLTNSF